MILTITIFILVLGLLIFVHECGHFIAAKKAGIKVEEFAFGFPPRIFSKKKGETIYSINLIPLGGYVKLYGEEGKHLSDPKSFYAKSSRARLAVIISGVLMNLVLGWLLFSIGYSFGLPLTSIKAEDIPNAKISSEIVVSDIIENSSADKAKISRGDIIVGADSQVFTKAEELQEFTKNNLGKQTTFSIKKYGLIKKISVILSDDQEAPLGVAILESEKIKVPFWQAPWVALKEVFSLIKLIIVTIVGFFAILFSTGKAEQVGVGPVGIWFIFQSATKLGLAYIIQLTALISVNLGIINILPFPALDGGRLIFWLIEIIRRKRVTPRIEGIVHTIGFVLLLAVLALITFRDITNLR